MEEGQAGVHELAASPGNEHSDFQGFDNAKKYLEDAVLYLETGSDAGEAKLLLGTLNKDLSMLEDACSYFNEHDAGYIECFDAMSKLDDGLFSPSYRRRAVIVALTKVLNLVVILCTPITQLEITNREQLNKLYKFYGLEQKPNGRLRPIHKWSRIVPLLSKKDKGRTEYAEKTVNRVLVDFLLRKAKCWAQSASSILQAKVSRGEQCRDFITGRQCSSRKCPLMHKPHDRKSYTKLIRSLLSMIEIK